MTLQEQVDFFTTHLLEMPSEQSRKFG